VTADGHWRQGAADEAATAERMLQDAKRGEFDPIAAAQVHALLAIWAQLRDCAESAERDKR